MEMSGQSHCLANAGADKIIIAVAAAAQFEVGVGRINDSCEGRVATETKRGIALQSVIDKRHRVTGFLNSIASQAGGRRRHVHLKTCSGTDGNSITATEVKRGSYQQDGIPGHHCLAMKVGNLVGPIAEDEIVGATRDGRILPTTGSDETGVCRQLSVWNVHVRIVGGPTGLNADLGAVPGLVTHSSVGPDGDRPARSSRNVTPDVGVADIE